MRTDLRSYDNRGYDPGRGTLTRVLWHLVNAVVFDSWLAPVSGFKCSVLRAFGAKVGRRVVIKPRVNIKYPWRLQIRDDVWIGEGVWIDNLADVVIASNVCLSQGVYLLTGNHDYRDPKFGLIVKPIHIEDGVWIAARTMVGPGVTMAAESVLAAGSALFSDTEENSIYRGNPATRVRLRWPVPCENSSS